MSENLFMNEVLSQINDNLNNSSYGVSSLSKKLIVSRSKLYRKIKLITGSTATEYIKKIRLKEGKRLLKNIDLTISKVSYKAGFSSPSYFIQCFKNEYGEIPKLISLK